ncbi:MAG: hypothetical protein ACO1OC_06510 [Tuberibacillus sp.]
MKNIFFFVSVHPLIKSLIKGRVDEMAPIMISILLWLVGILVIFGGRIIYYKLQKMKKDLKERAEGAKFRDNSATVAFQFTGEVIDAIPWYYVRLIFIIIGAVIIAIGFVPLGFLFT